MPTFHWLHECYKLIDRRLRKSLKHLYLVHPTFWLKSFVILTKPFVSSKFFRKLSYVRSLDELSRCVPVAPHAIPDLVRQYDAAR
ncbi:caytaxin-like [Ostrinia nubilalis]|uniref:caytaxin-like n=1 Tax=Ostrinia nubilalis TaxID=29057 RepID=UPI0030822AC0